MRMGMLIGFSVQNKVFRLKTLYGVLYLRVIPQVLVH